MSDNIKLSIGIGCVFPKHTDTELAYIPAYWRCGRRATLSRGSDYVAV